MSGSAEGQEPVGLGMTASVSPGWQPVQRSCHRRWWSPPTGELILRSRVTQHNQDFGQMWLGPAKSPRQCDTG